VRLVRQYKLSCAYMSVALIVGAMWQYHPWL